MTSRDIAEALRRLTTSIDTMRDRLNAADRELGDGDTGMTVADIVGAWQNGAQVLPDDIGEALLLLGREAGRATGSSLGSVIAIGLAAAGRGAKGAQSADRVAMAAMLRRAVDAISTRSGAAAGDKTMLDSLIAIRDALDKAEPKDDLMRAAGNAAADALTQFSTQASRLGRARMYGAKTVGRDDPGMMAVQLMLAAMRP